MFAFLFCREKSQLQKEITETEEAIRNRRTEIEVYYFKFRSHSKETF